MSVVLGEGATARVELDMNNSAIAVKIFNKSDDPIDNKLTALLEIYVLHICRDCEFIINMRSFNFAGEHPQVSIDLASETLLDNFVARKWRPMSEETILNVMGSVVPAIQYLHSNNIIYNDLHLSNILLVNGIWRLADMGACICLSEANWVQMPHYLQNNGVISPETLNRHLVWKASDIWLVGMLYICMSRGTDDPYEIDTHMNIKTSYASHVRWQFERLIPTFQLSLPNYLRGSLGMEGKWRPTIDEIAHKMQLTRPNRSSNLKLNVRPELQMFFEYRLDPGVEIDHLVNNMVDLTR